MAIFWLNEASTFLSYEDPNDPYLVTGTYKHTGATEQTTYKANGTVSTVEDPYGNVTTYLYPDDVGDVSVPPGNELLVRKVQRPDVTVQGVQTTYGPTEFVYDIKGNLEEIIDAKGNSTLMTYTDEGMVDSITDPNGHTTEFIYEGTSFDGGYRRLVQVKIPKGLQTSDGFRTVTFGYTDSDNPLNVTSVTDGLGNTVSTEYDVLDRITKVTDALGNLTEYLYEDGVLKTVKLPPNQASVDVSRNTSMVYDIAGRLLEILRDVDSSNQQSRVKYERNVFGEVTKLTRLKDSAEKSYRFHYDKLGRNVMTYDSLNNLSYTAWEKACTGHASTNARGVRHSQGIDLMCRPTQIVTGDPEFYDLLTSYNPEYETEERRIFHNLTQIWPPEAIFDVETPREVRKFDYDELGRLVSSFQTRAIFGRAVYGSDSYTDKRRFLYDELDRLVEVTYNNSATMTWQYDKVGNITRMVDPEGKATRYEYYRDNLLYKVILERGGQDVGEFVYTYDPAGRLDKIVYPDATDIEAIFRDEADLSPAGIGTGFDANGNIRFLRYQKSNGDLIRRFEWLYDNAQNRVSMLDVTPTQAILWEYGYDWLDRLVRVKRAEAADVVSLPATALQREYVYDESDNRKFLDDHVQGVTYHYKYKSLDHNGTTLWSDQLEETLLYSTAAGHRVVGDFVSYETFLHDADGNMTKRTLTSTGENVDYSWTEFDRLKIVESSVEGKLQKGRYDINGLRSGKTDKNGNSSKEYGVGITTSASVPGSPSSVAPSISYIQAHQVMGADVNGNFQFFLTDALGTVREVVDENGDVIQSYEFNEHGIPMPGSGASSGTFAPKTYQGALSVNDDRADSGLYLMGHRHYAAELGRFISRDPIGFDGGLNLFNGAGTNPVTFVDPSGEFIKAVYNVETATLYVEELEMVNGAWKSKFSCSYTGLVSGDHETKNDPTQEHRKEKGPIPRGSYYLGAPVEAKSRSVTGQRQWIPVLNKKTFKNVHEVKDPNGGTVIRDQLLIHPGLTSAGCITFKSEIPRGQPGYPGNQNYNGLLERLVNTQPMVIEESGYFSPTKHTVYGTLEVK